jgi:hypothetical protein
MNLKPRRQAFQTSCNELHGPRGIGAKVGAMVEKPNKNATNQDHLPGKPKTGWLVSSRWTMPQR